MQKKTRVRIWLYEDARMQMEGIIIGFDEYMNVVLDDAVEIDSKRNTRVAVGRCLLKGDSITLLQYVPIFCDEGKRAAAFFKNIKPNQL